MSEEKVLKQTDNTEESEEIDLLHIASLLWRKCWIIVLAGILVGAVGFSIAAFFITPQYSSSIMVYVNTSSISLGSASISISQAEISAAQSLVKTYIVILMNRKTMSEVIEKADLDLTYEELIKMIDAGAVDNTEVFSVTVTTDDPYLSQKIAKTISEVLPERVKDIIDGTSMKIVDDAVVNLKKVSPSITKYTAIGLVIGVVLACAVIIVSDMLDDVIRDDSYILQNYDIPILAKVPELLDEESSRYGYYSRYGGRRSTTTTDLDA